MDYDNTSDTELSPRKQTQELRKHIPQEMQKIAYMNAELDEFTGKADYQDHWRALDVFTEQRIAIVFSGGCTLPKFCKVLGIPKGVFKEWMSADDDRKRRLTRSLHGEALDEADRVVYDAMANKMPLAQDEKAQMDVALKAAAMVKKENEVPQKKEADVKPSFVINIGDSSSFDGAKVYESK